MAKTVKVALTVMKLSHTHTLTNKFSTLYIFEQFSGLDFIL